MTELEYRLTVACKTRLCNQRLAQDKEVNTAAAFPHILTLRINHLLLMKPGGSSPSLEKFTFCIRFSYTLVLVFVCKQVTCLSDVNENFFLVFQCLVDTSRGVTLCCITDRLFKARRLLVFRKMNWLPKTMWTSRQRGGGEKWKKEAKSQKAKFLP